MPSAKYILFFTIIFCTFIYGGNVYVYSSESECDVKVFITEHIQEADLIVYITDSEWEARDKDYIWYKVEYPYYAKTKIFYVTYKHESDVIIFIVDSYKKSLAEWRKNDHEYKGRFK